MLKPYGKSNLCLRGTMRNPFNKITLDYYELKYSEQKKGVNITFFWREIILTHNYHLKIPTKMSNCHSNNKINTFLFQRQPIRVHFHWQDEHMPAWLHHPVEKSHHSTWKYHQSSKYNERVFLIFHDPMYPLSSPSHMHFLKQYCQYEDPLKLDKSPCGRAHISVFVLGRCSPYPFKKVDCTLKGS